MPYVHFDMETADPDDVMTLAMLATHPRAELRGVTITPGGPDQVGLVRHVLKRLGRADVPVGVGASKPEKRYVSEFHYKWLGRIDDVPGAPSAEEVITSVVNAWPDVVMLTGAKLTNVANFIRKGGKLARAVLQGGFAGDSLVPVERRLAKFAGRETCPTFNLNGDIDAAFVVLESGVPCRLVSKNVCHGLAWTPAFHERVRGAKRTAGLDIIFEGMGVYLRNKSEGKKLHDPFAACCLIEPACAEWAPVEVYRERGEWGSKLALGSSTQITIGADEEAFFRTLTAS